VSVDIGIAVRVAVGMAVVVSMLGIALACISACDVGWLGVNVAELQADPTKDTRRSTVAKLDAFFISLLYSWFLSLMMNMGLFEIISLIPLL
jgi:hypothetical protein